MLTCVLIGGIAFYDFDDTLIPVTSALLKRKWENTLYIENHNRHIKIVELKTEYAAMTPAQLVADCLANARTQ